MTTRTDTRTITDRALAASADRAVASARAMHRPHLAEADLAVSCLAEAGLFTNLAYLLEEPTDWDTALQRVAAIVPERAPVSLVTAGPTPDLASVGWELVGRPPLMVRPAGGIGPAAPAEMTIAEVVDEPGLEVFERTLVDSYPDRSLQPYRWGSVHDGRVLGGPTRFFTGTVAGRPVATASAHVAAGVNLVEFVATAESARGRGYGAAVTWAATTADPSCPAVLIASDTGRPVYERLGYIAVSRWTMWHRPARHHQTP